MGNEHRLDISKGIPNLDLATTGGVNALPADKSKVTGTANLTNSATSTLPLPALRAGKGSWKVRGNTTSTFPQLPFNLTLLDSAGKKVDDTILGMPAGSGFSILAGWQDRLKLRALIGSRVSWAFGQVWSFRCYPVTVSLNGAYNGLYIAAEKIDAHVNKINIRTGSKTAAPLDIDYVIEQKPLVQIEPEELVTGTFQDARGKYWAMKIPDAVDTTTAQRDYCAGIWGTFLAQATSGDFASMNIDWDSFASFYLLQDALKHADIDWGSWYMTIKNGKLFAGPGWDYDGAWAAIKKAPYLPEPGFSTDFTKPDDTYVEKVCPWYARLLTYAPFRQAVGDKFVRALPKLHQLIADLRVLRDDPVWNAAIVANNGKWPQVLADPAYIGSSNYQLEFDRVVNGFGFARLDYEAKLYEKIESQPAGVGVLPASYTP